MKKSLSMGIITILLTIQLASSAPLAEQIVSKDLAVTNANDFEAKLNAFISQGETVFEAPVTLENSKEAQDIFTRLSTLLEVYLQKYAVSASPDLLNSIAMASRTLKSLTHKFSLETPATPLAVKDIFIVDSPAGTDQELLKILQPPFKKPLTQTEAFLQRGTFFQQALKIIESHQDEGHLLPASLFSALLNKERDNRDKYVFYHGQDQIYSFLYDLDDAIRTYKHGTSKDEDFTYLRFGKETQSNEVLADFLRLGFDIDHRAAIRKLLLSVNLSLFGNLNYFPESTFFYFATGFSQLPHFGHTPLFVVRNFLRQLGIEVPPFLMDKLDNLRYKYFAKTTGSLLQIFIPEDKVNEYVYLSFPFGVPFDCEANPIWQTCDFYKQYFTEPIIVKNAEGKTTASYTSATIDTKTYLDLYRNNATAIPLALMEQLQGRILLTNDFMLNPNSGVKIYRYVLMSREENAEYKSELNELVALIMESAKNQSCTPCKPIQEPFSKELAVSNIYEHQFKAQCLTEQAKILMRGPVTSQTRALAINIYWLLDALVFPDQTSPFYSALQVFGKDFDQKAIDALLASLKEKFRIGSKEIPLNDKPAIAVFRDGLEAAIVHGKTLLAAPALPETLKKAAEFYALLASAVDVKAVQYLTKLDTDLPNLLNQAKDILDSLAFKFDIGPKLLNTINLNQPCPSVRVS